MAYGYLIWNNGKWKFCIFSTLNACRRSAKNASFRSTDEHQIVRCRASHSKTNLEKGDVLLGFVYEDHENPKIKRYQPKNSRISYPIKSDGSLCYKYRYEVIL